ncbi:MAG: hypothetical protein EPN45_21220 [Rhizobiaceae bacterium]|nr:MAG: hypothetical protein EPN45_21220 [Rhizobiaceae bacterium]
MEPSLPPSPLTLTFVSRLQEAGKTCRAFFRGRDIDAEFADFEKRLRGARSDEWIEMPENFRFTPISGKDQSPHAKRHQSGAGHVKNNAETLRSRHASTFYASSPIIVYQPRFERVVDELPCPEKNEAETCKNHGVIFRGESGDCDQNAGSHHRLVPFIPEFQVRKLRHFLITSRLRYRANLFGFFNRRGK